MNREQKDQQQSPQAWTAEKLRSLLKTLPEREKSKIFGAYKAGYNLLLENPDGRALLKNNAQLRSMINTACGWPFSSNFKDDNRGETIESWLAQYNEEGKLASNSPGTASVSIFTTKPESRASPPSSNP